MKKILFFAISLFAVSAFAAGVVFKANPLALLQSGGGGEDKKAAKVEQATAVIAPTNVETNYGQEAKVSNPTTKFSKLYDFENLVATEQQKNWIMTCPVANTSRQTMLGEYMLQLERLSPNDPERERIEFCMQYVNYHFDNLLKRK